MQEKLLSLNPATEERIEEFAFHTGREIEKRKENAMQGFLQWRRSAFSERSRLIQRVSGYLRQNRKTLAETMTAEMGKPIGQAEAEIEKCAWLCDYFSEKAESLLQCERLPSEARESHVQYLPLGPILAIMPWNFPFWQVMRFAVPALMAGNTALLKHAPNVTRCALAVEKAFRESGVPDGVFQVLLAPVSSVSDLIHDPRIRGVTLTGSVRAGQAVAAEAGSAVKKTVLELGGSDPFIVLADADLEKTVETAVKARFLNSGQSCIAAKRFIVVEKMYPEFEERFLEAVRNLKTGDPMDRVSDVGPMARADLRDQLHLQIRQSVGQGARLLVGGKPRSGKGFFYKPTVLNSVTPEMSAGCQEVFGPAAALMKVKDAAGAVQIANRTDFGLGASIWTRDLERARQLAAEIEAGQVFINGMVASDPRLPFGGIKQSGYGRELSEAGIREFVNVQTVWIGPA